MKRLYTLLLLVVLTINLQAQSPEKISYQAIIRNTDSQLLTNQEVGIRISILQGTADGTVVYEETQSQETNENGLVSLEIGTGVSGDDFAALDWSDGPYFIKTETDVEGGTNYTIAGTSQLMSVPYALHAKTAERLSGDIKIEETDPEFKAWDKSTGISINESQIADLKEYLSEEVDGSVTNEIQDLSLNATTNILSITKNGTATEIDLSKYLDNTDTKLSETEVDAFVANNGYLTAEVDGDASNEIQDLSLNATTNILSITKNGTATEIDLSKYLDNTDTKLSETEVDAFVANNGYLTAEVDGDASNEIQDLSLNATTNILSITKNGTATEIDLSKYLDNTDTKLSETEVDAFVANNGYLTAEVDGDASNEIQDLSLNATTNILSITKNGTATEIDLSKYLDNTDTKLNETEVDAFVANNGYLTEEVDGSVTNEIQDLSLNATTNILSITKNGTATEIDLSKYLDNTDTKLSETEVDAFVANNGYLTSIADNSITLTQIEDGTANQVLTTDGTGNPQYEDKSTFLSSNLSTAAIFVGNVYGVATDVNLSGDATINKDGAVTISDNAVDGTDIALGAEVAGDMMSYDGTNWIRLPKGTDGQILAMDSGNPKWVSNASARELQANTGTTGDGSAITNVQPFIAVNYIIALVGQYPVRSSISEPTIAEIILFGGNFAPRDWAFCDGQILAISDYNVLFSLLGTTYGGNGTTTFALPDMRGRVAIHRGSGPGLSPYYLGQKGGAESVTLTKTQMPAHTHTIIYQ